MELKESIKSIIEAFKERIIQQIETEENEERKRALQKALDRGMELLEGKQ